MRTLTLCALSFSCHPPYLPSHFPSHLVKYGMMVSGALNDTITLCITSIDAVIESWTSYTTCDLRLLLIGTRVWHCCACSMLGVPTLLSRHSSISWNLGPGRAIGGISWGILYPWCCCWNCYCRCSQWQASQALGSPVIKDCKTSPGSYRPLFWLLGLYLPFSLWEMAESYWPLSGSELAGLYEPVSWWEHLFHPQTYHQPDSIIALQSYP